METAYRGPMDVRLRPSICTHRRTCIGSFSTCTRKRRLLRVDHQIQAVERARVEPYQDARSLPVETVRNRLAVLIAVAHTRRGQPLHQ